VPGGYGIVADPIVTRRPCAFAMIASDSSLVRPPALIGFGRLSLSIRVVAVGHSPVCASGWRRRHCDRPSRALRRHALATALLRRINRRTQGTTSTTRCFRTTGPTCRGSVTRAPFTCRTYTPRHPWSDASL